jgi:hypothetical protein
MGTFLRITSATSPILHHSCIFRGHFECFLTSRFSTSLWFEWWIALKKNMIMVNIKYDLGLTSIHFRLFITTIQQHASVIPRIGFRSGAVLLVFRVNRLWFSTTSWFSSRFPFFAGLSSRYCWVSRAGSVLSCAWTGWCTALLLLFFLQVRI